MNEVPGSLPQLAAMLRESAPDDVTTAGDHPAPASDAGLEHALTRALSPLLRTDPVPSAALRLLLDRAAPADEAASVRGLDDEDRRGAVLPLRVRGRRALAGALVLAVSSVGATGLSAAANTLPGPWQRQVSDFSRVHLPFTFPEPAVRGGDRPLSSSAAGAGSTAPVSDARRPDVEAPVRLAARPAAPLTPTDRDAGRAGDARRRGAARAGALRARGHDGDADGGASRDAADRPTRGAQAADRGPTPGRPRTGRHPKAHDRTPRAQAVPDRGGDEQSGPEQSSQAQSSPEQSGQGKSGRGRSGHEQSGRGRAASPAGSSGPDATDERDQDGRGRRTTEAGPLRTSLAEILGLPAGSPPGAAG